MREYAVVFEKTPTGYSAYVPDLPGLAAAGSSYEETEHLMRKALDFHLEGMLEDGDAVPDATTRVGVVKTEVVEAWQDRFVESA